MAVFAPTLMGQATANTTFVEYFNAGNTQWTCASGDSGTSMAYNSTTAPGINVLNSSTGLCYAPWAVGSNPINFQFALKFSNVHLKDNATKLGFAVALTTAIPGSMSGTDASLVFAFMPPGIYTGMRTGELTGLAGTDISGGLLKDLESVNWPQGSDSANIPLNWQWWCSLTRDASNNIVWNVYTDKYQNGLSPWWTKTFAAPSKSFQYISIIDLTSSASAAFQVASVVSDIYGFSTVTGGTAHTVTSIIPSGGDTTFQTGKQITITGTNFDATSAYIVDIGSGTSAHATATATYVSATTLTATLPAVANASLPYIFKVLRNGIDAELVGGITFSAPVVNVIQPHEVPVSAVDAADRTVQVYGCGFPSDTAMTFRGVAGAVTVLDPCHLSVVVPSGTFGQPAILVTGTVGGVPGTTIYDSASSGTWPPQGKVNFGYSPHPYMSFDAAGLTALRVKFTNPAFANYAAPLNRNILTPPSPSGACKISGANSPCWNTSAANNIFDYGWHAIFAQDSASQATYASLLVAEIARIDWTTQYGASFNLENAEMLATFYDALFPGLTPAQRTTYLSCLDKALGYYEYVTATGDTNSKPAGGNYSNRIAMTNGSGGIIGLALINSVSSLPGYTAVTPWISSTAATEVARVISYLSTFLNNYGNNAWMSDGGYVEGSQYAQFGGSRYVAFARALVNTNAMLGNGLGSQGLFATNVAGFRNFIQTIWDGTTFQSFNDTQPQFYGMPMLVDFGERFSQPDLLFLADTFANYIANADDGYHGHLNQEVSRYDYAAYAFMWRSTVPGAYSPMPAVSILANVNWAALRSSGSLSPDFVMGVKGDGTNEAGTNQHAQPDQTGFTIQSRAPNGIGPSEAFMIDPGYFGGGVTHSPAQNHSLNAIDGNVPIAGNTSGTHLAIIGNRWDDGAFRSVSVDATGAYAAGVTAMRRTVVNYANGSSRMGIVLDDIIPSGAGSIVSYLQTGQPLSSASGTGFTLTGLNSKLVATYDTTGTTSVSSTNAAGVLGCSTGAGTWSWVNCQLGTVYNTVQLLYTTPALIGGFNPSPMLMFFAPANLDGSGAITVSSADRSVTGTILVTLSDGSTITFTQTAGVWAVTASHVAGTVAAQ